MIHHINAAKWNYTSLDIFRLALLRLSHGSGRKKMTAPQISVAYKNEDLFLTFMSIMGQLGLCPMSSCWTHTDEPELAAQPLSEQVSVVESKKIKLISLLALRAPAQK